MDVRRKKMGKVLILPIKRKWFDMIRRGIKLEEYREIKSYYGQEISLYRENMFRKKSEKNRSRKYGSVMDTERIAQR